MKLQLSVSSAKGVQDFSVEGHSRLRIDPGSEISLRLPSGEAVESVMSREGDDLVIETADGTSVVLEGYFADLGEVEPELDSSGQEGAGDSNASSSSSTKYRLFLGNEEGIQSIVGINGDEAVPATPGSKMLLVDQSGATVEATLKRDGDDLHLTVESDGTEIVLEDYFIGVGAGVPVPVSLNGSLFGGPESASGLTGSSVSNGAAISGENTFTLLRISSTEYGNFQDSLPGVSGDVVSSQSGPGGFGGRGGGEGGGAGGGGSGSSNGPPLAANDQALTGEDAAVVLFPLGNDTDPDGDTLSIVSVAAPARGSVTLNPDNSVQFAPGSDFQYLAVGESATESFTYEVTDGQGGSDTATITVTVTGSNDAPSANPDAAVTDEDTPVTTGNVLTNDSDPDGSDVLTVVGIDTSGTVGHVTDNGDGTFNFDPNGLFEWLDAGESATTSFTYATGDGQGATASATVTITVNGADDATDPDPDIGLTDEDTAIDLDVLANDRDPDTSDLLTVSAVSQPPAGQGSVSINPDGTVRFDPGGDFQGLAVGDSATTSFTYAAQTPDGDSVIETVTVTIGGSNDTPDASGNTYSAFEDSPVTINPLSNDDDPDGDSLSISQLDGSNAAVGAPVTLTSGALVTLNADGTVSYTANGSFAGMAGSNGGATDTFTYTISDGFGGTDVETITMVLLQTGGDPNATVGFATPDNQNELFVFSPDTNAVPAAQVIATSSIVDGEGMAYSAYSNLAFVFDGRALYSMNVRTGVQTLIKANALPEGSPTDGSATGAAFFIDPITLAETFFVTNGPKIWVIDKTTGDVDPNGFGPGLSELNLSGGITFAESFTIDPATGIAYVGDDATSTNVDGNQNNIDIYSVDLTTGHTTFVIGAGGNVDGEGLAFGNDGKLYTEDERFGSRRIYEVDLGTGALTQAASFGGSGDIEGIAFNAGQRFLMPTVDLNGASSGRDYATTYTVGGSAISVVDAGIDLQAPRSGELLWLRLTLTNPYSGDQLSVGALPGGIASIIETDAAGQIVVTLYASDFVGQSVAQFETAAQTVQYSNAEGNGSLLDRTIEVVGNDTDFFGFSSTTTIQIDATPPLVLDLDGDGVEFKGVEEGIDLDVDGDGELERTAWAGDDDGVLVFDADEDGQVSGRGEFVFADYGRSSGATDLGGLRDGFDSNQDGILNDRDQDWDRFGVWNDADGNGQVDEGELRSLDESGIEAILLRGFGRSYYAEEDNVLVHEEVEVVFNNGSRGVAADAEFSFQEVLDELRKEPVIEIVTARGQSFRLDEGPVGEEGNGLGEQISASEALSGVGGTAIPENGSSLELSGHLPGPGPEEEAASAAATMG